jgi:hypothetical protein
MTTGTSAGLNTGTARGTGSKKAAALRRGLPDEAA